MERDAGKRQAGDEMLPRGSHGLPTEFVVRSQRERLFAGMARVVARSGYAATTVDEIAAESRVSRKALYTHFSGKEDLLLEAHRAIVERIASGVAPALAEQNDWRSAIRVLLDYGLEFCAREPELANLALVEVGAATPASRQLQRESLEPVRALLERGFRRTTHGVPAAAIDGMLGGIMYVIARTIEAGDPTDLAPLRRELMAWLMLMVDGPEAAERERHDSIAPPFTRP